jgi:single-stranded-DNA-specific exonuclease
VVEDTLPRIAKGVSRAAGQRETPARTLLCLEVLEERGLIVLREQTGRLQITLNRLEHKVDLEASELLIRLKRTIQNS